MAYGSVRAVAGMLYGFKPAVPLTGITAAVAGIIVNLALFFACHVFWPHGMGRPIDLLSVTLSAIAMIALFRFKAGVIPVIL
jgi:chromate transporter